MVLKYTLPISLLKWDFSLLATIRSQIAWEWPKGFRCRKWIRNFLIQTLGPPPGIENQTSYETSNDLVVKIFLKKWFMPGKRGYHLDNGIELAMEQPNKRLQRNCKKNAWIKQKIWYIFFEVTYLYGSSRKSVKYSRRNL